MLYPPKSNQAAIHTETKYWARLVLLIAICLLSLPLLWAQSAFYIGTHAGVNGSKFRYTEDFLELYPTTDRLLGANVGIDAGFQLGQWSFSTGLQYSQQGSNYQTDTYFTEEGQTAFFSARERLHFLRVPVLIGYNRKISDRIGYTLNAGPSFNFGLTGRIDETVEYFGTDQKDFQNYRVNFGNGVNDDYRPSLVGFQYGGALFFDLTYKSRLSLNLNWDVGVKDSFNPRYKAANDFFNQFRGSLTNRMAAITVGYQYRIPFADRY